MSEAITRHNVADGTYDCILTGYVKRQEKSWGKDCSKHFILSVAVRPAYDEDAETYFAELPLVYKVGEQFGFYDKAMNKNVVRSVTSADTAQAIDYAKKVFPAWAEFVEQLPDNATMKDAFAWFTDGTCNGAECRAKLTNREYEDKNTHETKIAHDAVLYAAGGAVSLDDFDMAFGASLKASGFKIGSKVKKAAKTASVASAATTTKPRLRPPTPPAPPSAPSVDKEYTGEDSWNAYEKNCIKNDPSGSKYWGLVKQVTCKEPSDYASFTSEDWKKCIDTWEGNF